MKRLFRVFVNMLAVLLIACTCFSLTACEDIRKLNVEVQVYTSTESTPTTYTLTVNLYRHLAPKTVDQVISLVNDGYYNDIPFYRYTSYSSQMSLGEFKYDVSKKDEKDALTVNTMKNGQLPAMIEGEFSNGSTKGSDLTNIRGSVGLWRNWNAYDSSYTTSSGINTGRGTWYIPTTTLSSYNGWFCVFGVIDTSDETTNTVLKAIEDAVTSTDYEEYYVYYTTNIGGAPVMNSIPKDQFKKDEIDDLFDPKESDFDEYKLNCYEPYIVRVPLYKGVSKTDVRAKVTKVTVA